MDSPKGPAYWPLRLLPFVAGALGLAGVVLPGREHLPTIGGLLFASALALELGGWARATRAHARPLATAACVGAALGTALLIASTLSWSTAVDPLIALGQ